MRNYRRLLERFAGRGRASAFTMGSTAKYVRKGLFDDLRSKDYSTGGKAELLLFLRRSCVALSAASM